MRQGREIVLETEWFSVEREYFDRVESPGGKPYYRINCPDGVMVVARTREGEIILVRQFRPAINQHTLELPSGAIDGSESPEEAAARELFEETGYQFESLSRLGEARIMANRNNCKQFTFFASGAVRDPDFVGSGDIEVCLANPARMRELIASGVFQQLAGVGALTLADLKLGTGFLSP